MNVLIINIRIIQAKLSSLERASSNISCYGFCGNDTWKSYCLHFIYICRKCAQNFNALSYKLNHVTEEKIYTCIYIIHAFVEQEFCNFLKLFNFAIPSRILLKKFIFFILGKHFIYCTAKYSTYFAFIESNIKAYWGSIPV